MTATKRYEMRGLPCRVGGQELPWYVSGTETYAAPDGTKIIGGGILEWCWDRTDAQDLLRKMQQDSRFSNLAIGHI